MTTELPTETNPTQTPVTSDPERMQKIKTTHQQLAQLQKDFQEAIDAFAANPSALARLSSYWAKIPLWLQVSSGLAVFVPLILLSITFHLAILFALSFFATVIYSIGSYLLTDNYQRSEQSTTQFKILISNFSNLLVNLIDLVDALHAQFKEEIEKLAAQNTNLTDNVSRLDAEITELSKQISVLSTTEKELRAVSDGLNQTLNDLRSSSEAQSALLQQTLTQLNDVQLQYEDNHKILSARIDELETLRGELENDLKTAKNVAHTLGDTLANFTGVLKLNKTQNELFLESMRTFIDAKKPRFEQITVMMEQTQKKLTRTADKFGICVDKHEHMLHEQESIIQKLEKIAEDKMGDKMQFSDNTLDALLNIGMFSGSTVSTQADNEVPHLGTIPLQVH